MSYIDLSNLVNLQRSFIGSAGATSNPAALNQLDASLNALSMSLNQAGASIGPTLTYQSEVKTILDREKQRLDDKKNSIDAAYTGQKRMIDLTTSATNKNKAYNLILIIVVITLLAVLGIKQIYDNGIIPNTVLDIMNIIILVVGIIYAIVLYLDASSRSNMDFDQIALEAPKQKSQDEIAADRAAQLSSGNLSAATAAANAGCIGAQCCPVGSTFNEYNKICVPSAPSDAGADAKPFYDASTRIVTWRNPETATDVSNPGCGGSDKYDELKLACKPPAQGFTTMTADGAQPYTPCEFSQYNVYNRCGSSMM
jgi:hypothetical protein